SGCDDLDIRRRRYDDHGFLLAQTSARVNCIAALLRERECLRLVIEEHDDGLGRTVTRPDHDLSYAAVNDWSREEWNASAVVLDLQPHGSELEGKGCLTVNRLSRRIAQSVFDDDRLVKHVLFPIHGDSEHQRPRGCICGSALPDARTIAAETTMRT